MDIGEVVLFALPEPYQEELKGAAASLNVSQGLLGLASIAYELTGTSDFHSLNQYKKK